MRSRRSGPRCSARAQRRRGFILLFGTRNLISADASPPLEAVCPRCGQFSAIVGKTYRPWFTIFFIPVFPIGGSKRFSQCQRCKSQIPLTLDDLRQRMGRAEQEQSQQAIGLYNSLRSSPANSITLNELMLMYAQMREYDQAVSAARDFPQALNSSEQCMCTLGRVLLAMNRHAEALQWFDAALARNPMLGEAQYHKAIALMTITPPQMDKAMAPARAARNAGYPNSDALVREVEARARGEQV
jgi:predicted Zn-dependent protease